MESFSPDVPAGINYALVLVLSWWTWSIGYEDDGGAIKKFPTRWFCLSWYWFVILKILAPLMLFWVLDRTGAINDTSLFSAFAVVFAASVLIKPSDDNLHFLTKTFQKLIDKLTQKVSHHAIGHQRKMHALAVAKTATDKPHRELLYRELLSRGTPAATLDSEILRIEGIWKGDRTEADKRIAIYLHDSLRQINPAFDQFLWEAGISTRRDYVFSLVNPGVVAVLLVLGFAGMKVYSQLNPTIPATDVVRKYYTWRFIKPNNSSRDVHRARVYFRNALMAEERNDVENAIAIMADELAYEASTWRVTSDIFDLLLTVRPRPLGRKPALEALLRGMRNSNRRIAAESQVRLRYIASIDPAVILPKNLEISERTSPVDIDATVSEWERWLSSGPGSKL